MNTPSNQVTDTTFSHADLPVTVIHNAVEHAVPEATVVINLGSTPATIHEHLGGYIAPISSTILTGNTRVSGELLILIPSPRRELDETHFRSLNWADFYDAQDNPGTPVLLKSPVDHIGTVQLSTAEVLSDDNAHATAETYDVKANLWFSPSGTDCGIHHEHPFIETHTQIMGIGKMQKFRANDHATIFEDQELSPGQTQPSMFGRWAKGSFAYPWHQYRADTDAVWLAIEYHPTA